jgi:hypothetical protein
MGRSFLLLGLCLTVVCVDAAQNDTRQERAADQAPYMVNRTTVGLDANTSLDEYIERLHAIRLFLALQHKVFMAAYTVQSRSFEDLQHYPQLHKAVEKIRNLTATVPVVQNYFKVVAICYIFDAVPLPAQEIMDQLQQCDFIRRAQNKASICIRILGSSDLVDDHVMLERLSSIEKNTIQELDTYFDLHNLLRLDALYKEISQALRSEIMHAKKTKQSKPCYRTYLNTLPETLISKSIHRMLRAKKDEYAGMDLSSLTHTTVNIGIDLLQEDQDAAPHAAGTTSNTKKPGKNTRPPLPSMSTISQTYSPNSAHIIQHEHLVRICDPENAMAIDLDLRQEGSMLHTYDASKIYDSYAPHIARIFKTRLSARILTHDPVSVQKHRFSPLVDRYLTQLGHEYLVLRDPKTKRECILIPEDMDAFQRLFNDAQRRNMQSVIHVELDGHAYFYTTQTRVPCVFTYEIDPKHNTVISRAMSLYP